MRTPPAWVRGDDLQPPTAERIEKGVRASRDDVARERLHSRVTGPLQLDREAAIREMTDEQRVLHASRPRTRRWKELDRIDEEIDRLTQRQAQAVSNLLDAERAVEQAPAADAATLATWLSKGEKGQRPAATVYERQRERDAAQLLVEAAGLELDRTLERRVRHIEKHRPKMLEEARRDVEEARARLLEGVRTLPRLRQALVDARESLIWAAKFPAPVSGYGNPGMAALGLRRPVEQALGTKAQLNYGSLVQVLEADAAALADAFSREQQEAFGTAEPPTPSDRAMWHEDPAYKDWERRELEQARALAMQGRPNQPGPS